MQVRLFVQYDVVLKKIREGDKELINITILINTFLFRTPQNTSSS